MGLSNQTSDINRQALQSQVQGRILWLRAALWAFGAGLGTLGTDRVEVQFQLAGG